MKATKWFSKAMTLGFVFFMALLLVNPENSLEFVAMIPFGAFAAYLLTENCSAEYAPAAFKAIDGKQIFVVAGAPACMEDLKAAGIENFIHVRVNVLDTLKSFNAQLLK